MSSKSSKPTRKFPTLSQLLEQGFWLDLGKWPDTPLQADDKHLGVDSYGHVLIARAPLETE
jgi:hypothetical protein